ncbi:MATE family efflux transporter [Mesomycoplasma lagogenitalium]|uniref:Probable multidrug resistance protein NorM n=1 Tax=Mesomycoplasma lagogenitalium TaxID=171286 RepID=A0ABY8LWB3_9BACT|nr:MATE family efflux transporter [Mesomycoplasma lagogenitalium]WGI36536.1 MATE family efflux transporter [Mesomycoplasma lagogenitalium]
MIKNKKWLVAFKEHFPNNWVKWKTYLKFSLPVIITGILFALNGFIDNFMVANIAHGVDSLSYANSWSGIVSGLIAGISIVCSVLIGQYWGSLNYKKIKEVMRMRVLLTFICTTIFAIFALTFTNQMISVFYRGEQTEIVMNQARDYLMLITVTWIIFSWTSPMSALLAETGHGKEALISSIGSLLINIILNAILIYGLKLGVKGAAYASIAARIFGIIGDTFFVFLKVKKCLINPLTIYKISKATWKKFFIRIHSSLLIASNVILIILRNVLFNTAFPQGTIGNYEWAIGAAAILGLTGAISEIFLAVFGAISSNISIFVGKYLGNKEFEIAKQNANELKGFHTTVALLLSIILIIFALIIPKIDYFSSAIKELDAKKIYLNEIRNTLFVVAFFNPLWIWYVTSDRLIASGGRTNLAAFLEFILEAVSLIWLIIIALVIVPNNEHLSLWHTYWIFFALDFLKIFIFEIIFIKVDWARHIDDPNVKRKIWEKNVIKNN